MRKLKEVLRLHSLGLSQHQIAGSCSISQSTVHEYVSAAESAGVDWPLPDHWDEQQIEQTLFPPRPTLAVWRKHPEPDWTKIHEELQTHKDLTLQLVWHEGRESNPDGYDYSRFCDLYRRWLKKLDLVLRQEHRAGEKMFVDYAGATIPIHDPESDAVHAAAVFVAVLGASSYTFAEATTGQDLRNWIGSHMRALEFFGGATEVVVPDNLKSAVTHPSYYEPDLNPTYRDLGEHYGVAIIPARPYRARDKAKAEVGVQVVQRWIVAALRKRKFCSPPPARPSPATAAAVHLAGLRLHSLYRLALAGRAESSGRLRRRVDAGLGGGDVLEQRRAVEPYFVGRRPMDGNVAGAERHERRDLTGAAQSADQQLTGTTTVNGGLNQNTNPPPVISPGGVLNAASYSLDGSLAPGSLISIFGSLLAQTDSQATDLPLPTTLGETTITVAGRKVPLLYTGANQVNAMIPYDLAINATHQVVAQRGTAISVPEPIGVLSSQSGIFTKDATGKGLGIVVRVAPDGTQSVVATDNPAHAGDAIVIYCDGLGDVDPRQVAGSQTPFTPLSQTLEPAAVSIGGVSATVFFSGLTPGFTGLYQVNAFVPAGVTPGDNLPLVITQSGRSSPPVSISVR